MISLIFMTLFLGICGQVYHNEDLVPDIPVIARISKSSFDAQFHQGRCPDYFYQINDECVFFGTNGRIHTWNQIEHLCMNQIARLLNRQASSNIDLFNVRPTRGVRQLTLNTPDKTKILEGLYQDYDELNYAIRLPSDYKTLAHCSDQEDDYLPQFCQKPNNSTGNCFETSGLGFDHICLRQVDCDKDLVRFACEFTLPGSPELSGSRFRHCPEPSSIRVRLSVWAWILVAVGAMLFLLFVLGGVLAFMRNSKVELEKRKRSQTTISQSDKHDTRTSLTRHDTLNEPTENMLIQNKPVHDPDRDYLDLLTTRRASLPTLATVVRQDDGDAYV